jgi:hypothetical protein
MTLHQRLAHISPDSIRKMVKSGVVAGVELIDDGSAFICEACEQAKAPSILAHSKADLKLGLMI